MTTNVQAARMSAVETPINVGAKHIRWGLGLFIFGLVIGFIPLLHYMHGSFEQVGEAFLKNVTLWWGCAFTLAVYVAQVGGLGMIAIGLCYVVLARDGAITSVTGAERMAPVLCAGGIIAEFVAGVAGYYAVAAVLPNFYSLLGHSQCRQHVAWKRPSLPTKGFLFGDFRLTLAFLRGRGCAWIAALINRPTSGLIRHGNRIAFSFGTWGAYGCAASAGCIVVGRMRDAESQSKKKSASN